MLNFRCRKMMPLQNPAHVAYKNYFLTCCFSMHVQTATVIIGVWHLILNMLALALLMIIYRDPNLIDELRRANMPADVNVDMDAPALPTPLSKIEPMYVYREHSPSYQPASPHNDPGGLVYSFMVFLTIMMIYGTVKGKPSHLLPFLAMQLFDLALTLVLVVRYFYTLEPIHHIVAKTTTLPWREKLLELSPEQLMAILMISFICVIWLKSYCAFIVFRCYKYLTLRNHCMRTLLPCLITDIQAHSSFRPEERPYSTLLPNYDEAIAHYLKQAPPPSYHVAMSNFQMPPVAALAPAAVAPLTVDLAGAVANVNGNESPSNNNYMSNNNNTVHVNANTTAAAAAAAVAADSTPEEDDEHDIETIVVMRNSSPPSYNIAVAREQEQQQQENDAQQQQQQQQLQQASRSPVRGIQLAGPDNGDAGSSQA